MEGETMNGLDAMRLAIERSGASPYALSKRAGRVPSYVSQLLRQGSKPTADTLAMIGDLCGYRLALVPDACELPGDAIIID